jgi:iron complex outermembrane receptor protein
MLRKNLVYVFVFLFKTITYCQTVDSVKLNEVMVDSYLGSRPLLRLPASVSVIDSNDIKKQSGQSLVPVISTVPGVRMEERSSGSYRLSIRGSLLRSPFGIRNVKIYLDEFPLTDAGGNTYLNLLDLHVIHSIEILKGPDGSLFGENSGGVVRMNVFPPEINEVKIVIGGGSFGLFNEYISISQRIKRNILSISEGWQHSDGYRQNSRLDRKHVQLTEQLNYRNNTFKLLLFYTNLNYGTPGGLTQEQWIINPSSARPPSKKLPGALEQKAGVYNSTFYGGISNQLQLNKSWSHRLALFGSYTDFENPFITNYEIRNEHTFGARSWLEASNRKEGEILLKFDAGLEAATTASDVKNYGNKLGNTDTIQKFDNILKKQLFTFSHLKVDFYNRCLVEAGLSLNFNQFSFYTRAPYATEKESRSFIPQLMPKIAASYQIASLIALRASISKGYSSPAIAEIRSSDNQVNTALQPENSWSYEIGTRVRTKNSLLRWDLATFYYRMKNAIVLKINESGQEYFVNAGGTQQFGMESEVILKLIPERQTKCIRAFDFHNSLTYSSFMFNNYISSSGDDYSGNKLTGVPSFVSVSGLLLTFPFQLYLFLQHSYTSAIFLDDANTVSTKPVSAFLIKAGWRLVNKPHFTFEVSGGLDNVTNERYSLGNDLNAFGGRYFNAAMPRNYFFKVETRF